jgi:D-arabinose 1-dehydrogenase-like Zn-dependent alcohol dehydrogenase
MIWWLTETAPTHDLQPIADPLSLIGGNKKVMGTIVGTRNDVRMALQFAERVRQYSRRTARTDLVAGACEADN